MQESFLQYVWLLQYFDKKSLFTTQGDPVEIFKPGMLNRDAGPDFLQARIRVGVIQWVGTVEVHTQSSGWVGHGHHEDAAYDTVILHVVWKDDRPVIRRDGTPLPTIELRGRVGEALVRNYRQLISSSFSIPCQKQFPDLPTITKVGMFGRALTERLERKAEEVLTIFASTGSHWEETAYQWLAGAFGFKLNRDPFVQLARSLPLRILQRHDKVEQVEALLFGQAGFLEEKRGDDYYLGLRKEFQLLSHKYQLDSRRLSKQQWLFLRLRPSNFPTLRLAQFGSLVVARRSFFAGLMEIRTTGEMMDFFRVPLSPYWSTHYRFSKSSAGPSHVLGQSSVEVILVNAVVPLMTAYARSGNLPEYMDRALRLLEQLRPEQNGITRRWSDLGSPPQNAAEAQGQIELFNTFCQLKRCLQCAIGAAIIRPPNDEPVVDTG